MKNKAILCLLLVLLCLHVYAQQRKRTTTQRKVTTTAVNKPAKPAVTKTRKVGEDGFVWYELKKGGLYGAADIEGKTIIPIEYTSVYYKANKDTYKHYFHVKDNDFEGIYTRFGFCIIPTFKHFTSCSITGGERFDGRIFLGVECKNNNGEMAFYDIRGNEVISLGNYERLWMDWGSRDTDGNLELANIHYRIDGWDGVFDLNGKKLCQPLLKNNLGYIVVYQDKLKIVNVDETSFKWETQFISGTFSENTRFNYDNFDRIHYPFEPSLSNSSSSSNSTSSSSPSRNSSSSNSTSSSSSRSSSSRSNSSSSSSGHQQRQVWKERWRNCTACDPDRKGYCRNCHGRGGFYIGNIYNVCGICGGTGSCTMCGGRGEYKETYSTWE